MTTEQLYRELRYPAMVFPERTPEQRAAMIAEVDAAFVWTFGDGKSSPADGFIVGGMGWITHNEHEMDRRTPQDCPAWNARIEKARRDIAEHKDHILWREQVDAAHRVWRSEDVSGLIEFIQGCYQ